MSDALVDLSRGASVVYRSVMPRNKDDAQDVKQTQPLFIVRPKPRAREHQPHEQQRDDSAAADQIWGKSTSTMWARLVTPRSALAQLVVGGRGSHDGGTAIHGAPIHAVGAAVVDAQPLVLRGSEPAPSVPSSPAPATQARHASTPRHSASSPLFRAEALAAYQRGERAASVLRITSVSRWALLLAVGTALCFALGLTMFGHVEERSAARGVLRAPFGVQPVVAQVGGTVRELLVQAGDPVTAGQLLARLDATPLRSELQEAEQRLAAISEQWTRTRATLRSGHQRTVQLMATRLRVLEQRQRRQGARIGRRQARAARLHAPELDGVLEGSAREETVEAVEGARDDLLRLSDELSSLRLQVTEEQREHDQQLSAGDERVRESRGRRDALALLLSQTELHAPSAGRVESLRVQPGQVVQAAEWVARIVSDAAPSTLLAFVPERDVAFLRSGAAANVELDQLPVGEFGLARAHVTRVADELADPSELTSALGANAPEGPHVRVELTLDDDPSSARIKPYLRPGTLVTARIALRDRRLLAIVFEPARKWLEQ